MSKLRCPNCNSSKVAVRTVTTYMVNTGELYCHSVKSHDSDAEVMCLKCDWEGERSELQEGETT